MCTDSLDAVKPNPRRLTKLRTERLQYQVMLYFKYNLQIKYYYTNRVKEFSFKESEKSECDTTPAKWLRLIVTTDYRTSWHLL
jgi:hypothetical protein